MKILLNVYACEPNRGSEPGVGWHWAVELAKDKTKEVHVLTRANNKEIIDGYWANYDKPDNLHFHYYDLPKVLVWAKHHGMPVNLYYSLWLYGAGCYAKKLNSKFYFDMAHHLTFGVFRDAPFLFKLNVPYVIGPVGGGEYTPASLMCLYGTAKGKFVERLRKFVNKISVLNPYYYVSYRRASLILTKTDETRAALGYNSFRDKSVTKLEIGIDRVCPCSSEERDKHTFIYVGRFIFFKAIELTLQAFKIYHDRFDDEARLVLIGKGELRGRIESFAKEYNLEDSIEIIDWIEQKKLQRYYQRCTAMLFPSLHDSSGNVVLEALSNGMPVVSLDCGGPAVVLGEDLKSLVVKVGNNNVNDVANDIASTLSRVVLKEDVYTSISNRCVERARKLLWSETVCETYKLIGQRLFLGKTID